jgi:hypothetical protein
MHGAAMPRKPTLYLWMSVAAAMAMLFDIARGPAGQGYLRPVLLALVSAGSLLLSALTWQDR